MRHIFLPRICFSRDFVPAIVLTLWFGTRPYDVNQVFTESASTMRYITTNLTTIATHQPCHRHRRHHRHRCDRVFLLQFFFVIRRMKCHISLHSHLMAFFHSFYQIFFFLCFLLVVFVVELFKYSYEHWANCLAMTKMMSMTMSKPDTTKGWKAHRTIPYVCVRWCVFAWVCACEAGMAKMIHKP